MVANGLVTRIRISGVLDRLEKPVADCRFYIRASQRSPDDPRERWLIQDADLSVQVSRFCYGKEFGWEEWDGADFRRALQHLVGREIMMSGTLSITSPGSLVVQASQVQVCTDRRIGIGMDSVKVVSTPVPLSRGAYRDSGAARSEAATT